MRRSEINQFIHEAIEFFEESHFYLPEWILWSPAIWEKKGKAYDEIRLNHLGWDVTDFGKGRFWRRGLRWLQFVMGIFIVTKKVTVKKS